MSESDLLQIDCGRMLRLLDEAESLRSQLSSIMDTRLFSQASTRVNSASNSPSVSLSVMESSVMTPYNMEAPSPAASTVYLSGGETSRKSSRSRRDLDSYRPTPELAKLLPSISRAVHRRALVAIDKYGIEMVRWKNGFTALHWAAKSNRPDICSYLLSRGADPTVLDASGKLPKDYTSSTGVLEILSPPSDRLHAIVDFSTLPAAQAECLETISRFGWSKLKWGGGWTIMHWAFQNARQDVVEYLRSIGVPDDLKDDKGRVPSYYARRQNFPN